jgi:hypothetical protein
VGSVGTAYQATTGEDTASWEGLACAVMYSKMCELAIALCVFVGTSCKSSIYLISNQNPCIVTKYMEICNHPPSSPEL